MAKSETALYFTNVIAIGPQEALLAGHLYLEGAEPSVTRVMMIDQDDWFHVYDIPEVVYSALQRSPRRGQQKGDYCFLGRAGLLREHPSGQSSTDATLDIDNVYLMDLCEVDGELYACGTQNQVLRQNKGVWQRIDQGLYVPWGRGYRLPERYRRVFARRCVCRRRCRRHLALGRQGLAGIGGAHQPAALLRALRRRWHCLHRRFRRHPATRQRRSAGPISATATCARRYWRIWWSSPASSM